MERILVVESDSHLSHLIQSRKWNGWRSNIPQLYESFISGI